MPMVKLPLTWWLRPEGLIVGVLIPLMALIWLVGEDSIRSLSVANHLATLPMFALMGLLLVIAVGAFVGRHVRLAYCHAPSFSDRALDIAGLLTIFGYAVWFTPLALHPGIAVRIFAGDLGAVYQARQALNSIPGITTLTECGIAYVVAYGMRMRDGSRPRQRRFSWYLYAIFGLGFLRVFVNSERLALLELIVPFVVVVGPFWASKARGRRLVLRFLPYMGVICLLFTFAATEYFRSWVNFYGDQSSSLLAFSARRIAQYYTLAVNTGLTALDVTGSTSHVPYFSLTWLYSLPVAGTSIMHAIGAAAPTSKVLALYGDSEFNNFSGLVGYIWDFGWLGGALFFGLIGLLMGSSLRGFESRKGWLGCLYPVLFMALVAMIRIPYLTSGRMFVAILTLIIMIFVSVSGERRATPAFERVRVQAGDNDV